jgi:tRNA threonylcarbamoyladenosine biosynthesis protein TsaE
METIKVFKYECRNVDELPLLVKNMLSDSSDHRIFAFSGEMGAGKTTLIKEFCLQLGVVEHTSSPTFTIVNEYKSTNDSILYHFDFYRIKNVAEAFDLGFETYLYSGNYCFIEWPEKVEELIPATTATITIETNKENRIITMRL